MNREQQLHENGWRLNEALGHLDKLHTGDDLRLSDAVKNMLMRTISALRNRCLLAPPPDQIDRTDTNDDPIASLQQIDTSHPTTHTDAGPESLQRRIAERAAISDIEWFCERTPDGAGHYWYDLDTAPRDDDQHAKQWATEAADYLIAIGRAQRHPDPDHAHWLRILPAGETTQRTARQELLDIATAHGLSVYINSGRHGLIALTTRNNVKILASAMSRYNATTVEIANEDCAAEL